MADTLTRSTVAPARRAVSLDDKYQADEGRVFITGIQALIRLTLEQRRLDTRRGLNTSVFVSGYEGSPLGGLDLEFGRAAGIVEPAGVVFRPGLNEELAATAVAGTQLLDRLPGRRVDGVTGFWYGKNPGLDRAADAIRHANTAGTTPLGGAVAWIGDDPNSKSSTIPSSCEPMARSLMTPLLAPSSVAEIIDLGLHAVALSRASGLWTALKIVADIADASATIDVTGLGTDVPDPDPGRPFSQRLLLGPHALDAEQELVSQRLQRALDYARTAELNRVVLDSPRARIGVIGAGLSFASTLRALEVLGLDGDRHRGAGLRVIQIGMPWPVSGPELARLTDGLEEVIVVEDKLEFLETELKAALYGRPHLPAVYGKTGPDGRPFLPAHGVIEADDIARAIAGRLPADVLPEQAGRMYRPAPTPSPRRIPLRVDEGHEQLAARTPFFCSGCPHNISTRAGDDQLVGVGIGCHAMVALDGSGRGNLTGVTQMGGEGAQWIGMAPFTEDRHFVQNLGDGTFFHSGSLAIRAAVAAGVTMTYKLLYNDAVAMTGGQVAEGRLAIPDLTRLLAVEGVQRIVVTTPEPAAYNGVELSPIAEVRHRDDIEAVQQDLAARTGVTVMIHDDRCAAEERRLRKRGRLTAPKRRVWINQRVCEGCGDCAAASSCMSVTPIETEFGRKTAIHQSSCNQDFSCLQGDCPSFVVVDAPARPQPPERELPVELAAPAPADAAGDRSIRLVGIGGTGIVTVAQILQMAAHIEGWHAAGLDQTGLSQKGGPVVSDVRLSRSSWEGSLRATEGSLDALLAFDGLNSASDTVLASARPGHTVAVVNTTPMPTAAMVRDPAIEYRPDTVRYRIDSCTAAERNAHIPAQWIAERLFGDHMPANMVLLGAALQNGAVPISVDSVEAAIRLNGAAVDTNLTALRWGRAAATDPGAVTAALAPPVTPAEPLPTARRMLSGYSFPPPLIELLERLVSELVGYQDARYARRYLHQVAQIAELERSRSDRADLPVTGAFARNLYKLMAYKDEYEVARLHLDQAEAARLRDEFGPDARPRVMLHPPVLRALGLRRKVSLGRATGPAFKALRAARRLRGTGLDPFGRTELRRIERSLPDEYTRTVSEALGHLSPATGELVVSVAGTPDLIRGYEEVKLRNLARYRDRVAELMATLSSAAEQ
ncbi:MAG TPA: indolepyruvate ferredoxin oxidoreductase family protein [Acidimicrobiales bacterium]|nr:indolepyruvate ferredoxin oxidoreductase family protein [Acidimicrobiales bacterium]